MSIFNMSNLISVDFVHITQVKSLMSKDTKVFTKLATRKQVTPVKFALLLSLIRKAYLSTATLIIHDSFPLVHELFLRNFLNKKYKKNIIFLYIY